MEKTLFAWLMISVWVGTPLTASPREELSLNDPVVSDPVPLGPGFVPRQAVLYNNGPLTTDPGGGAGGADASILQNISLGMTTLGAANQGPAVTGNRIADDFVIPAEESWDIATITVFQYQTGAPTAPTPITALNLQIWDGPPNVSGSSVVWGDLVTDVLISSVWSNIYRVSESAPMDTTRGVFANTASIDVVLAEGTYWIDHAATGDIFLSGPWAPPLTLTGQTVTGDALQFIGGVWQPFRDGGTQSAQGVPFLVEGSVVEDQSVPIPTLSSVALLVFALILVVGGVIVLRYHR